MITKQQLIDRLHKDDTFNAALSTLDDDHRTAAKSLAETLVSSFADALSPIMNRIEGDSFFAEEIRKTLEA